MGSNDPFDPVYPPQVPGPPATPPKELPPKGRPWLYGLLIVAVLLALAVLFHQPSEIATPVDQDAATVQPVDEAKPAPPLDTAQVVAPDTARPTVR